MQYILNTYLIVSMIEMNIAGLDKAQVLAVLYNNAKYTQEWNGTQLNFSLIGVTDLLMTPTEAQQLLHMGWKKFDCLYGRVMKIDLTYDEVNTSSYNQHNGPYVAEKAIESLRKNV